MTDSIEESTINQIIYDNFNNDSLTLSGNEVILKNASTNFEIKMNSLGISLNTNTSNVSSNGIKFKTLAKNVTKIN